MIESVIVLVIVLVIDKTMNDKVAAQQQHEMLGEGDKPLLEILQTHSLAVQMATSNQRGLGPTKVVDG